MLGASLAKLGHQDRAAEIIRAVPKTEPQLTLKALRARLRGVDEGLWSKLEEGLRLAGLLSSRPRSRQFRFWPNRHAGPLSPCLLRVKQTSSPSVGHDPKRSFEAIVVMSPNEPHGRSRGQTCH